MDAVHEHERPTMFAVLTGVTAAATLALLVWRAQLLVSVPALLAVGLPWLGLTIYLRQHSASAGREGRYLDWWSVSHVVGGVLLGLFDVGLVWVVLLVVWWECVETASRVFEYVTNRFTDIVVAVAGWGAAQWLVQRAFTVT